MDSPPNLSRTGLVLRFELCLSGPVPRAYTASVTQAARRENLTVDSSYKIGVEGKMIDSMYLAKIGSYRRTGRN
jgi:hypothetical protein